MRLEGLHHITMITGDAPATAEFNADALGTISLGVPSIASLDFCAARLEGPDTPTVRAGRSLRFTDRDELQLELVVRERLERTLAPVSSPRRARETA